MTFKTIADLIERYEKGILYYENVIKEMNESPLYTIETKFRTNLQHRIVQDVYKTFIKELKELEL